MAHTLTVLSNAMEQSHNKVKSEDNMNRFGILVVVFAGLAATGLIVLSSWEIPAPTVAVNKVVPDENLPK